MPVAADAAHPALLDRRLPAGRRRRGRTAGRSRRRPAAWRSRIQHQERRGVVRGGRAPAAARGTGRGRGPSSSPRPTGPGSTGGAVPVRPYRRGDVGAPSGRRRSAPTASRRPGRRSAGSSSCSSASRSARGSGSRPVRARCRMSSAMNSLTIEAVGNGRSAARRCPRPRPPGRSRLGARRAAGRRAGPAAGPRTTASVPIRPYAATTAGTRSAGRSAAPRRARRGRAAPRPARPRAISDEPASAGRAAPADRRHASHGPPRSERVASGFMDRAPCVAVRCAPARLRSGASVLLVGGHQRRPARGCGRTG